MQKQPSGDKVLISVDDDLITKLQQKTEKDKDVWSLPKRKRRDSGHTFFQYPAMMVPSIQRLLVEVVKDVQPGIHSLLDPYVGAGTSLTAGMHNGLSVYGQDINPLAVLVSKVRSGPFFVDGLSKYIELTLEKAKNDTSIKLDVDFPNREKWFRNDVAIELSKLRRAIKQVQPVWARRFMWVTLAETIRLTSNDRTTTYKLHVRPKSEIEARAVSPIGVFEKLLEKNLVGLSEYKCELSEKGYLNKGRYTEKAVVSVGDTKAGLSGLTQNENIFFDLLVTSPPYGDNKSTITYGQHAYLPLQWIDLDDIDPGVDKSCLDTTLAIDSNSIGGRLSRKVETQVDALGHQSYSLKETLAALLDKPRDRIARVAAFYDDFIVSIDNFLPILRDNSYLIFTVGNRHVGGIEIPNHEILREIFEKRNVILVTQEERQIHNKRMPHRNKTAKMMRTEKILIFRKVTKNGVTDEKR